MGRRLAVNRRRVRGAAMQYVNSNAPERAESTTMRQETAAGKTMLVAGALDELGYWATTKAQLRYPREKDLAAHLVYRAFFLRAHYGVERLSATFTSAVVAEAAEAGFREGQSWRNQAWLEAVGQVLGRTLEGDDAAYALVLRENEYSVWETARALTPKVGAK